VQETRERLFPTGEVRDKILRWASYCRQQPNQDHAQHEGHVAHGTHTQTDGEAPSDITCFPVGAIIVAGLKTHARNGGLMREKEKTKPCRRGAERAESWIRRKARASAGTRKD